MKQAITLSLALILCPFLRASDLPAPLPGLMNQQQLAKWKADQAAEAKADAAAQDAPTQFYTGKPYDAEAGGYIFKYRTYNPEMARWTTADPSGFPDGVNNMEYHAIPNTQFDPDGLTTETYNATNGSLTITWEVTGTSTTSPTLVPNSWSLAGITTASLGVGSVNITISGTPYINVTSTTPNAGPPPTVTYSGNFNFNLVATVTVGVPAGNYTLPFFGKVNLPAIGAGGTIPSSNTVTWSLTTPE